MAWWHRAQRAFLRGPRPQYIPLFLDLLCMVMVLLSYHGQSIVIVAAAPSPFLSSKQALYHTKRNGDRLEYMYSYLKYM